MPQHSAMQDTGCTFQTLNLCLLQQQRTPPNNSLSPARPGCPHALGGAGEPHTEQPCGCTWHLMAHTRVKYRTEPPSKAGHEAGAGPGPAGLAPRLCCRQADGADGVSPGSGTRCCFTHCSVKNVTLLGVFFFLPFSLPGSAQLLMRQFAGARQAPLRCCPGAWPTGTGTQGTVAPLA